MKYSQDREASGEILRLLIQEMAKHPAAFTPLNYSVWYEHKSGINHSLSDAIGRLHDNRENFDDAAIERLYFEYISELDTKVERAIRESMLQVLSRFAEFTKETDIQASKFSDSLKVYNDVLKQDLDSPKLVALINSVASDTNKMLGQMQKMHSELAATRLKADELYQELQTAREEALIDPLTGILNRRGFESSAKQMMAEHIESNQSMCLLMIDIDHFKQINDSYGHLVGDKAIRAIAETLKSKVRGQDLVARMGGEEFAVLLVETDIDGARIVAEHIRRTIAACQIHRLGTQEKIGGITVSVGLAANVKGNNLVDFLDQADKALFASKKLGRNRTTVHDSSQ